MLKQITPIILTYNEEDNLYRSLGALDWADRILVIDSGSTDRTRQICSEHDNVEVIQNPFVSFAQQCNFALEQKIDTDWVLSMDADYIVSDELHSELSVLEPTSNTQAYSIGFIYLINGQPLSGSLYPPRVCLYRRNAAEYQQDGHAHRVKITGRVEALEAKLLHDDRKPYQRWLSAQKTYAEQEASKLKDRGWRPLAWTDRLRRIGLAPAIILPYTYIVKGLFKDGRAGLAYCKQRFIAEWFLFKELFINAKRNSTPSKSESSEN